MIVKMRVSLLTSLVTLSLFTPPSSAQPSGAPSAIERCDGDNCILDQGWTDGRRIQWYETSQGSRLIPLDWFLALEQPTSRARFLDNNNIERYGYIPLQASNWNKRALPLGFVIDRNSSDKADIMCGAFPSICANGAMKKPWVGMTCSACHTNEITHNGKRIRIEGAPTLADFESFLNDLTASLKATANNDDGKFDRFAASLLAPENTDEKRQTLKEQIGELAEWRTQMERRNNTEDKYRYGYARLDAQGYILNKIVAISGADDTTDEFPPDAGASYPFVWNTSQQQKIQWNGIATNLRYDEENRGDFDDYGALIRNTSEVIGVFAHIETNKTPWWRFWAPRTYPSSVRAGNLGLLEKWLTELESPRWPNELFGEPTPVIVADDGTQFDGAEIYQRECASCHAVLKPGDLNTPLPTIYPSTPVAEVPAAFVRMSPITEVQTDIFLACNTFLHISKSGNFAGRRPFWFFKPKIKDDSDKTANMLTNAAVGSLLNQGGGIAKQYFVDIAVYVAKSLGIGIESLSNDDYLPGVSDEVKKDRAEQCLTATPPENPAENILAYKARPLNGVWATAPYLHNGSAPTLYDLLLPAKVRNVGRRGENPDAETGAAQTRPESFHVGSREFDPVKVGFSTDPGPNSFEYRVRDDNGEPIPGNYNSGHEYGVSLSEPEKRALIEYLKTL